MSPPPRAIIESATRPGSVVLADGRRVFPRDGSD